MANGVVQRSLRPLRKNPSRVFRACHVLKTIGQMARFSIIMNEREVKCFS